jgi:uncharacterized protein YndB with AHSA1/START domain
MSQAVKTKVVPIQHTVVINKSANHAFRAFTAEMIKWWPKDYGIGGSPLTDLVIEPRVGGHYYERGENGVDTPWGEVRHWEQGKRVVLAWRINAQFAYEPALNTEVEVRFVDQAGGCRVSFEHRGLEAMGEAAEAARASLNNGWEMLLGLFKAHTETA